MPRSPRAWLALLATGAALGLAACTRQTPPAPRPASAPADAVFVGSAACATCHGDEASSHARTRHAATLHLMEPRTLGAVAPPTGPIPGTDYALSVRDGRYRVGLAADPARSDSIDLAFGSGRNGVTYAAVIGNALAEVRMSWDVERHRWFRTPGQEGLVDRKLGKIHRGDFARRCVGCHAVTLPPDRALPERRFLGVGCESCHGPGSAHVVAMRADPKAPLQIGQLSRASAGAVNRACDRCHTVGQPATDADLESSEAATRRFPLYGLSKSRCFQASRQSLSCLHCHDPHTPAPRDLAPFDAACLRCHGGTTDPRPGARGPVTPGKPCPVEPAKACVSCHMPKGRVMPETESPAQVRDHFIRIHRDGAGSGRIGGGTR